MARIAPGFECVVKAAHDFDRLDVDRVLFFELVLLVARNEREPVDMLVKISKRKLDGVDAAVVEKRERTLVLRLKIVQRDVCEVGDDHISGNLADAALGSEIADVPKCLRLCPPEVFAKALMLN